MWYVLTCFNLDWVRRTGPVSFSDNIWLPQDRIGNPMWQFPKLLNPAQKPYSAIDFKQFCKEE